MLGFAAVGAFHALLRKSSCRVFRPRECVPTGIAGALGIFFSTPLRRCHQLRPHRGRAAGLYVSIVPAVCGISLARPLRKGFSSAGCWQ